MRIKLLNIFFFFITIAFFNSCLPFTTNNETEQINFEQLSHDSTNFITSQGRYIKNKSFYSNKDAHNGTGSILLPKKTGFTIGTIFIDNSKAIKVSVWRKGGNGAYLVFKNKTRNFTNEIRKAAVISENGWEKISYIFRLPPFTEKDSVYILLYNNSNNKEIYFDEIEISIVENIHTEIDKFPAIELKIDSNNIAKLLKYRNRALKDGLIRKKNKNWVDALFISNKDTFNVEIRFKGDWLDHLISSKWSFRVKIKDDNYWHGFKVFSLQNPDSKSVLDEYIYHEILEDNDILTTKYGFIPLKINGIFNGIFSFEEHFTRQLVESKNRREGPILKIDEENFWAMNYSNMKKTRATLPIFNAAKILPFNSKRIKKNKTLKKNYLIAQDLLYTLKNTEQIKNIIDIEKFANFYAIADLTGAYHSLIWHNVRFYYNPVSNILEPIAFDGYTETGIFSWTHNKMTFECCRSEGLLPEVYIITKQFKDSTFREHYFQISDSLNRTEYLTKFFTKYKVKIDTYEKMLSIDYPDIKYNNFLTSRVDNNDSVLSKREPYKEIKSFKNNRNISKKYHFSIVKKYVNIYPTKDSLEYDIENYNSFELLIIGYSKTKKGFTPINNIKIDKYKNGVASSSSLKITEKIKYIYISDVEKKDTAKIKVSKFIKPQVYKQQNDITSNLEKYSKILEIKENKVIFKNGEYSVNKPIIIPEGYEVIINKNTNIDFIDNAYILSYSPIFIYGTSTEPVNFNSSDSSAKGITVIKANTESSINYLNIENFNTFSKRGWKLTGAITFYNSDVRINNMLISNNNCEDALNIINSKFAIYNCNFNNIYSDAFDSDFSDGEISNCNFNEVKNDAIDFSGSKVDIINCKMNNIGDKAVSAGEKSNLSVINTKVKNANIAFASKDKSVLIVKSSEISNCEYAYASYVKKKEFGASNLIVSNTKHSDIKQLLLLDRDCTITIDEIDKVGTDNINLDKLYEKFKK